MASEIGDEKEQRENRRWNGDSTACRTERDANSLRVESENEGREWKHSTGAKEQQERRQRNREEERRKGRRREIGERVSMCVCVCAENEGRTWCVPGLQHARKRNEAKAGTRETDGARPSRTNEERG